MKKIKYLLLPLVVTGAVSCGLDNLDGPNAQVYGSILDAETGELIEQEIGTSSDAAVVQVIEYGYAIREPQSWKIMTTGEYRNDLIFAGTYDVILNRGNFIALDTIKAHKFKKGENKLDFEVIPNIRIKNPKIEKTSTGIRATFNLEYAHPTGKIARIALFGQEDKNPSSTFYLSTADADVSSRNLDYASRSSYAGEQFEVEIEFDSDQGRNMNLGRSYFFRIGAVPTDLRDGIPERYNYSPVVEIKL